MADGIGVAIGAGTLALAAAPAEDDDESSQATQLKITRTPRPSAFSRFMRARLPRIAALDEIAYADHPPAMLDTLRTRLHGAITSPVGDALLPVRVTKDLARRANIYVGMPLCSTEELAKRKAAVEKLRNLRANGRDPAQRADKKTHEKQKVLAPVTLYFEQSRNNRELLRIEELLTAKNIKFQKRDLTGDEATMKFVTLAAKCKDDDLPVLFVAEEVIGNYAAIVAADVSGELAKKIGL